MLQFFLLLFAVLCVDTVLAILSEKLHGLSENAYNLWTSGSTWYHKELVLEPINYVSDFKTVHLTSARMWEANKEYLKLKQI